MKDNSSNNMKKEGEKNEPMDIINNEEEKEKIKEEENLDNNKDKGNFAPSKLN